MSSFSTVSVFSLYSSTVYLNERDSLSQISVAQNLRQRRVSREQNRSTRYSTSTRSNRPVIGTKPKEMVIFFLWQAYICFGLFCFCSDVAFLHIVILVYRYKVYTVTQTVYSVAKISISV